MQFITTVADTYLIIFSCFKLWSLLSMNGKTINNVLDNVGWNCINFSLVISKCISMLKYLALLRRPDNFPLAGNLYIVGKWYSLFSLCHYLDWLLNCSSEPSYTFIHLVLSLGFFKPWKTIAAYKLLTAVGFFLGYSCMWKYP